MSWSSHCFVFSLGLSQVCFLRGTERGEGGLDGALPLQLVGEIGDEVLVNQRIHVLGCRGKKKTLTLPYAGNSLKILNTITHSILHTNVAQIRV